jgi:hypothetical protein
MNAIGNMLNSQVFQQGKLKQSLALKPPSMKPPSLGSKIGSGLINNAGNIIQGIDMLNTEKKQN